MFVNGYANMSAKMSFNDVANVNRILLRCIGLPVGTEPSSRMQRWINYALLAFVNVSCCILYLPQFYVITGLTTGGTSASSDLDQTLDALMFAIGFTAAQLMFLIFALKQRKVRHLFATCETLWTMMNLKDLEILSTWANRGRTLTLAFLYSEASTALAYLLTPVLRQLYDGNNSTTRTTPFLTGFDVTRSPTYELAYTLQAVVTFVCATAIIAVIMAKIFLLLNACGHFVVIRSWLHDLSEEKEDAMSNVSDRDVMHVLRRCIAHHQTVLDFCLEFEEVCHMINLILMMSWLYMVSVSAVKLSRGSYDVYKSMCMLCFGLVQLLFLCWPPERLSHESSEVTFAVYCIPWYKYSKISQNTVIVMLMRAQRPVKITAGKLFDASMDTYSTILSRAMSFYAMLKNVC